MFIFVVGCGAKTRAPQMQAKLAVASEAPVAVDAADVSSAGAKTALSDTPIHRELAWLVDLIGHRKGVVTASELAAHWDKVLPGAINAEIAFFERWGMEAEGAVIEKIEVDDPTYFRGYVVAGDKRWRVVLTIADGSKKIDFLDLRP